MTFITFTLRPRSSGHHRFVTQPDHPASGCMYPRAMTDSFVPDDYVVPLTLKGSGFRLAFQRAMATA